jgi:hypothetical protein
MTPHLLSDALKQRLLFILGQGIAFGRIAKQRQAINTLPQQKFYQTFNGGQIQPALHVKSRGENRYIAF